MLAEGTETMNLQSPSAALVGDHQIPTARVDAGRLGVAWVATLLLSRLPEIVLREGIGIEAPWINLAWIAIAVALVALGSVAPVVRPFRAYLVVMLTVLILTTVVDPLVRGVFLGDVAPADSDPELRRLLGERVLLAIYALGVVPVLAVLGYRGREAYLALGRLTAPAMRVGRREVSWMIVGPIAMLGLVAMTTAFASSTVTPTADLWQKALPLLPVAWLAAGLNAFAEEVLYRAGLLGPLARVVGSGPAVAILAVWFGLGHWYGGIPSGVMGLVLAGSLGLLFGKAMVQTRGLGWPWALHFSADAAIYTFLALGAVAEIA